MMDMTLPALTKPELNDYVVTLSPSSRAPVPHGEASAANPLRMNALASLVERLKSVETLFREAQVATSDAHEQQVEFQRRVEKAEADKVRLEIEVAQLRGQLEAVGRVPRWVRRVFGASQL
jgi:hypothetical protein